MAEKAARLEEALSLALNLSPRDKLRLVEQVVSSIENEMPVEQPAVVNASAGRWGAEVIALLDQLDLTDWEQMDIPDVGAWVHQLRRHESERHEKAWQGDE
jgi:hypothetical protein